MSQSIKLSINLNRGISSTTDGEQNILDDEDDEAEDDQRESGASSAENSRPVSRQSAANSTSRPSSRIATPITQKPPESSSKEKKKKDKMLNLSVPTASKKAQKRKHIQTNFENSNLINQEALDAQRREKERLDRLEKQKQAQAAEHKDHISEMAALMSHTSSSFSQKQQRDDYAALDDLMEGFPEEPQLHAAEQDQQKFQNYDSYQQYDQQQASSSRSYQQEEEMKPYDALITHSELPGSYQKLAENQDGGLRTVKDEKNVKTEVEESKPNRTNNNVAAQEHEVIELSSDEEISPDEIQEVASFSRQRVAPTFTVSHTQQVRTRTRWVSNDRENADRERLVQSMKIEQERIKKRRGSKELEKVDLTEGRLLVNAGHAATEPDVFVAPHLTHVLQPHQLGGIRFMYDNLIESIEEFKKDPLGYGCILAHSMGLGKTIQIITFSEIFLRATGSHKILIIMPINTIQNWKNEYDRWMPKQSDSGEPIRKFEIFLLGDLVKTFDQRVNLIEEWNTKGGVLLVGYDMFRLLVRATQPKKVTKPRPRLNAGLRQQEERKDEAPDAFDQGMTSDGRIKKEANQIIRSALLDPGPDLVVCDEGHKIKNLNTDIAIALGSIRTKRRAVLTGYPLQNNLMEYYCMVDFVRPMYLGTKKSFSVMFEKPIKNGQCVDSTPSDLKIARARTHVLVEMLKGFVQRRTHHLLKTILPESREFVLLVRKSPLQHMLYRNFVIYAKNEIATGNTGAVFNPLKAFAACSKIWNHPDVLAHTIRRKREEREKLEAAKNAKNAPPPPQQQQNPSAPANGFSMNPLMNGVGYMQSPHGMHNGGLQYFPTTNNQNMQMMSHPQQQQQMYGGMNGMNHMSGGGFNGFNNGMTMNPQQMMMNAGMMSQNNGFWSGDGSSDGGFNGGHGSSSMGNLATALGNMNGGNLSHQDLWGNLFGSSSSSSTPTFNMHNNNSSSMLNDSQDTDADDDLFSPIKKSTKARIIATRKSDKPAPTTLKGALLEELDLPEEQGLQYDWAEIAMAHYKTGNIEHGYKMTLAMSLIEETTRRGEKILLFSQNLTALSLIEEYLERVKLHTPDGESSSWYKNRNYFRFDGSTTGSDREKLINRFNNDPNVHLFLISTRAGSLGINLVSANRCIILDACWNPCHDAQAVCRVYRYGQQRRTYIYRLIMDNCMEKAIFNRQISKHGLQQRVVDDAQVDANITQKELETLLMYDEALDVNHGAWNLDEWDDLQDPVLESVMRKFSHMVAGEPFLHESLLFEREEGLSEQEKLEAQLLFEKERHDEMYGVGMPSSGVLDSFGLGSSVGRTNFSIPAWQNNGFSQGGLTMSGMDAPALRSTPMANHIDLNVPGSSRSNYTPMPSGIGRRHGSGFLGGASIPPPATVLSFPGALSAHEPLRNPGGSIQKIVTDRVFTLPPVAGPPALQLQTLPAGSDVMLVRTGNGVYLRLSNGTILDAKGTVFDTGIPPNAPTPSNHRLNLPPPLTRPNTNNNINEVIELD